MTDRYLRSGAYDRSYTRSNRPTSGVSRAASKRYDDISLSSRMLWTIDDERSCRHRRRNGLQCRWTRFQEALAMSRIYPVLWWWCAEDVWWMSHARFRGLRSIQISSDGSTFWSLERWNFSEACLQALGPAEVSSFACAEKLPLFCFEYTEAFDADQTHDNNF